MMTKENIIRMAEEAGIKGPAPARQGFKMYANPQRLERFAALVAAAERNKVAQWIMARGYSTGHGDTVDDLLKELELTVREEERELCAQLCEEIKGVNLQGYEFAKAIRGEK